MSWLVDASIIWEIRKGARCNPHVTAWYDPIDDRELFLSPLVLGEIREGIELARPRDPRKAAALEAWLEEVRSRFAGRSLVIDDTVADAWGRMHAIRPIPVIDGLLAATAKVNRLTLATRNAGDVAGLGASVRNPFDPS